MQRLGRNYQSIIQEQGSAVQRAGASEKARRENERHMDRTGPEQSIRAVPVRSSPLLFGCAGVIVRPHVHGA
jgi:hypothetical protein